MLYDMMRDLAPLRLLPPGSGKTGQPAMRPFNAGKRFIRSLHRNINNPRATLSQQQYLAATLPSSETLLHRPFVHSVTAHTVGSSGGKQCIHLTRVVVAFDSAPEAFSKCLRLTTMLRVSISRLYDQTMAHIMQSLSRSFYMTVESLLYV